MTILVGALHRPAVRGTVLAATLLLTGACVAVAQTVRDPEIVALAFQGNRAFSDGELEAVIRTRETRCVTALLFPFCALTDWGFAHRRSYLDTTDVAGDELRLRLYYRTRGFFEARVESQVRRQERKARVWFFITEGPPTLIDSLHVRGVPEVLDSVRVRRLIGLRPGDRFDQFRLAAGEDSLVRALRELGYIRAAVLEDLLRRPGGTATVGLEVSAGHRFRVGEVRIDGAGKVGNELVRSLLRLRPGEYFSQSRLEDSQRTLFAVDAIRFASVSPEPAGDSIVDLRVQVTPAATRGARGGFGWSTDRCLQTEARLTHRNLFGGARRFEVTARLDNIFAQQMAGRFPCSGVAGDSDFRTLNFLLQGELTLPVFLSGRNSFQARVFGERESIPDVFIREGVGAQVGITREFSRRMSATLSYQPQFTGFAEESADIFFCVNFAFCTPEDVATVTRARWLAPVSLAWIYNRTNDPIQPSGGYYLSAEVERADRFTGSDYRYARFTLQAADFETIEPGLVFGIRVRGGFVEPTRGPVSVQDSARESEVIHPSKRFFAGGSQSVRGFGQNLLGPRVLVADQVEDCPDEFLDPCVARLAREDPGAFVQRPVGGNAAFELGIELRQRLGDSWGLVLFVDAGNVWKDLSELDAPIWTPGAGLRFMSPVGPLRLDLGYDPTGAVSLPVVVSLENGSLVELRDRVMFDPFTFDRPSLLREILRRFQIHFSIGEAF